jgi:hypothetical protein
MLSIGNRRYLEMDAIAGEQMFFTWDLTQCGRERGIPGHNFPCLALESSIDLACPLLLVTETDKTSLCM